MEKKIPKLSSFHTIKTIEEMSSLLQNNSMITYRAQHRAERRQRSDQIWGVGEELGDTDRGGCVARTVALLRGCPC